MKVWLFHVMLRILELKVLNQIAIKDPTKKHMFFKTLPESMLTFQETFRWPYILHRSFLHYPYHGSFPVGEMFCFKVRNGQTAELQMCLIRCVII